MGKGKYICKHCEDPIGFIPHIFGDECSICFNAKINAEKEVKEEKEIERNNENSKEANRKYNYIEKKKVRMKKYFKNRLIKENLEVE